MNRIIFLMVLGLLVACDSTGPAVTSSTPAPGGGGGTVVPPTNSAQVKVVSNRIDLISGGDVLVEVLLENAAAADDLVLRLGSTDVTNVLQTTADNPLRLLGLIEGLDIGNNVISLDNGNALLVTNHPKEGPVFTGPHILPWKCQDSADNSVSCNQDVEYKLHYVSTDPNKPGLQSYDAANPPNDVAQTTTDNGETLPFIVREESGYQARDKYTIYTLFKLGESWTPAAPQSQWNRRLMVTHGGNCRGDHDTDRPKFEDYAGTIPANPAIASSYITGLGLGWSVLSTAQLNLGHNCNVAYQAESLMMAKERFIEQYGELRYTVGSGCSGGAISQNMIANAYPGLYQGLLTTCTYPDVMSTATQFADYHILLRYFELSVADADEFDDLSGLFQARDGTFFSVDQQNAIYGHEGGILNASLANSALFAEAVDPQSGCGGIASTVPGDTNTRYHPDDNPGGARCDVLTFMQNMVGPRDRFDAEGREKWSQIEIDLFDSGSAGFAGFAGFPLGNAGVQYGLVPLQNGEITPMQFLELNTNVGAVDMDLNLTTNRLEPDTPALPNAYRTGILNTIVNMDTVPIINMTGPDPGAAHDSVHGYWLRYRFEREFPNITREQSNFVMWGGATALIGDPNYMNESLIAMAEWLDAIEADTSDRPLAEKIRANKTVTDRCRRGGADTNEMCTDQEMAVFGTPRTSAGDVDNFGDMVQCQLRPFSRTDNYGLGNGFGNGVGVWQEADWVRLEAAFTTTVEGVTGPFVCDFSQRPILWEPTITWLSYQDVLGQMITGGEQMEPADFPSGWASPAFSNTWEPGWQTP